MSCFSLSVRLRTLPLRRRSQERNLARIRTDSGLLHAEKWSKKNGSRRRLAGPCLLPSLTLGSPFFFFSSGYFGIQEKAAAAEDQNAGRGDKNHPGGRLQDGRGAARHHMQQNRYLTG